MPPKAMGNYVVSALKYRPGNFSEVVGQEHVTKTLETAISTEKLSQAYLFTGPRGVGKTTCARIFAKMINAEEGQDIDNQDYSFNVFELDGASNNGVEEMRDLRDQVRIPPAKGKYKVYIIDEVHMLSTAAFNAFLKTLEEPPPFVKFILATTEKHKVLPTILSRCQVFDFRRIGVKEIQSQLKSIAEKENVQYEEEALRIIAEKADGALRDALSILDRQISFTNGNINLASILENLNILDHDYYFRLVDCLIQSDHSQSLLLFDEIVSKGFQGDNVLLGLSEHFRNLLVCRDESTHALLNAGEVLNARYKEQAGMIDGGFILTALDLANKSLIQFNAAKNQRLHVELALIKMCHINQYQEEEVKKKRLPKKLKQEPKNVPPPTESVGPVSESKTTSPEKIEPEAPKVQAEKTAKKPEESPESGKEKLKTEAVPSWEPKKGPSIGTLESLKNELLNEKPIVEEEEEEELDNERTWEIDEVIRYWKDFGKKNINENNIPLKAVMNSAQLKSIDEKTFSVVLASKVQRNLLEDAKLDIVAFLKNNMGLNTLAMKIDVDVNLVAQEKKAYTSQERYEEMKKTNPKLERMKNQLDLDLDP